MTAPLSGSRAWLVQRGSAVYLSGFLGYVLLKLAADADVWTYESWRAWILDPAVTIAVLLFFVALLLHAWVGMRDVILDYVHPLAARLALLALLAMSEAALGAWVLMIVLGAVREG